MRTTSALGLTLSFTALAACGTSDSSTPTDDGLAPTPAAWVASAVFLPTTSMDAQAFGLDLDGDGTVDNQLGNVLSAMMGGGLGDPQAAVDAAVAHGELILLSRVEPTTGTGLDLHLGRGTDPVPAPCVDVSDTVCGQHLHGDGSFTQATNYVLAGRQSSDVVSAGPGAAFVPVAFGGTVVELPLSKARVRIDRSASPPSGVIAGGIPQAAIDTILVPALAAAIQEIVVRDCPTPTTCMSGSEGETLLALLDANSDGTITAADLAGSAFLAPDLNLDGAAGNDALSVGVKVEWVGATF